MTRDLTAKDVAHILTVSVGWVQDRCNDGSFPNAYKLSGRASWRIPQSDIEAYRRHSSSATNREKPRKTD